MNLNKVIICNYFDSFVWLNQTNHKKINGQSIKTPMVYNTNIQTLGKLKNNQSNIHLQWLSGPSFTYNILNF